MIKDDFPTTVPLNDLAYLIDRCSRILGQKYDDRLNAANVTVTDFNVLVALGITGECSHETLADALTVDCISLSLCLSRLDAAGLIVRTANDGHPILLTAAARSLILTAEPLWQAAQAEASHALGADVVGRLADVLATLEALQKQRKR